MLYIVQQYKALFTALLRSELGGAEGGSFMSNLNDTEPDNYVSLDGKDLSLEPDNYVSLNGRDLTLDQEKAINALNVATGNLKSAKQITQNNLISVSIGNKSDLNKEVTPSAFKGLDIDSAQYALQYLNSLSNRSLSKGDGGANVSKLQYALLNLGFNLGKTGADGAFGPIVKEAVKGLQADLGLEVTGDFTANTFDKLKSELTLVVESKKSKKTVATQSEDIAYEDQPQVVSALSEADIAAKEADIAKQREALMNEINGDETQEYNTKIGRQLYNVLNKKGKITRRESSNFVERSEQLSSVNVAGLHMLLKKDNLQAIYDGSVKDKYVYFAGISNFDAEAQKLKDEGYVFDALEDDKEMGIVMTTIGDYLRTQKDVPTMSSVARMKILFDFDGDTHLESDSKKIDGMNYVSEKQITRDTFKGITSNGYNTLLENLGLPNIETEMAQNLFTAREKFHRELGTMFERGYKLGELLVEGGVQRATEMMYAKENEKAEAISKIVEEKLIPRLEAEAGQELNPEERKQIKLLAIGLMTGGVRGVGASFDINDYVKVVDSLQIGLFNGVPGVGISKKLWEKNGFEFTGSVVNFYIPVLTAQYHDEPSLEKVQQTFEEEFEGDWTIAPSISLSVNSYLPSIAFTYENKDTSKGIESKVEDMGEVLDKMLKDIQEGKSFDDISYIESKGKEEKSIYNKIKDTYDTYGESLTEEQQVLFIRDIKEGSLNYYKMGLYNNASKSNFNINTFGIGRGLGDFNPLTFIYVGGENLSLDWKKVIHSIDREREVTAMRIALERIGAEVVEYKGFTVLAIPNGSEYAISSDENVIQAEYDKGNDMLYITGDIRNISVAEYSMAHGAQKTLVIGQGVTSEKGMLLDTTENLVSIDSNLGFNIDYSKESLDNTEVVRGFLFNIIDTGTLTDRNTPGMMDLQRDIYNYKRTGTPVIADAWNQFVKVFTDDKMTKYASGEKADDILGLREYLTSTQDSLNDSEKVLILQSVSSNLMKKDALEAIEGKVMIEGGKTNLLDYDNKHTRAAFFNKIFEKDLGDIASNINDARNRYYDKNKDKTEYTFTSMAEGDIAFTGVFSKRGNGEENVNGLMPYTGAYNVASFEGGADMVPIDGKSIDIIDVLPTGYLENVKTILEEITGKTYDSLDAVKDALKSEDSAIKFEYDLFFAKMSECLNDAVIMKNLNMLVGDNKVTLGASSTSEVYTPEYAAQKWALGFTENKKDDGNGGTDDDDDGISSDPDGEEAGNQPDDNGPNI